MNYDILIRPLPEEDGGGFVGLVPDLQGCMSDGETQEEALLNTLEAMGEWIELHENAGRPVPKPGVAQRHAIKRDEALISALHVLTERNGALEDHVEEIEQAMTHLLDMLRNNTGWSFPVSAGISKKSSCDA